MRTTPQMSENLSETTVLFGHPLDIRRQRLLLLTSFRTLYPDFALVCSSRLNLIPSHVHHDLRADVTWENSKLNIHPRIRRDFAPWMEEKVIASAILSGSRPSCTQTLSYWNFLKLDRCVPFHSCHMTPQLETNESWTKVMLAEIVMAIIQIARQPNNFRRK